MMYLKIVIMVVVVYFKCEYLSLLSVLVGILYVLYVEYMIVKFFEIVSDMNIVIAFRI